MNARNEYIYIYIKPMFGILDLELCRAGRVAMEGSVVDGLRIRVSNRRVRCHDLINTESTL